MSNRRDDNALPPRDAAATPPNAASAPIPADLVDQFFDNELNDDARRAFLRALPRDLDTCQEVASTRRMLDMLRAGGTSALPMQAPDLTGRIIARVDRQRGFASRHVRRLARVARLAMAASLVLVVGAIAAVQRVAPDATRLAPAPAPLTTAFRQTEAEVAQNLGSLASTLDSIQRRVTISAPRPHTDRLAPHAEARSPRADAVATMAHLAAWQPRDDQAAGAEPRSPRTLVVTLRVGAKAPRAAVWTRDMAPEAGDHPADAREASRTIRIVPARFIDAEGRCSGVVMPLGIERLGRDDLAGPFVLPGSPIAPTARPAELLVNRRGQALP